jgi:hypothetical protein
MEPRPGPVRPSPMMTTRRALALVGLLLVLAACGDDAPAGGSTTTAVSGVSGTIHRSGGFAGFDQTWVLGSDGTVLGPDGYTALLTAADRAQVEAAVDAAGFFDLDPEYLPADPCCDRFTYEVTLTRGTATHTVVTMDGAEAPEGLFALITVLLEVVQP